MLTLGRSGQLARPLHGTVLGKVSFEAVPPASRADYVLATSSGLLSADDATGYAAVLCAEQVNGALSSPTVQRVSLDDMGNGDVVSISPAGYVRTLWRSGSRHNAIFATDRCNSYCLMCSQPPKDVDDSGRVAEHLRLLELVDPVTEQLGITGGEPTLLKDGLLDVVRRAKELLPRTAIHILSNGRLFYYGSYARRLGEIQHPDLMVGVPIYSDLDDEHDWVVQARGAFDETMIGLQNLGRFGVPIEIRVVLHRLTYKRLPDIAAFIYRNLTFAAQVAFMGLEPIGFAVPNMEQLWIDPWEYRAELETSVQYLAARGMAISVYNHQLCVVPESIWKHCRQAISDWKNEYLPICDACSVRGDCGGLFASGVRRRHSAHLEPQQSQATAGCRDGTTG